MKKIRIFLVSIICLLFLGCEMNNTPTKSVEKLLNKYQTQTNDISTELDDYLKTLNIESNYTDNYRKIYLKQYKDLKYVIKDERIDGDKARVSAEIEVYDLYKTETDVSNYIATNPEQFNDNGVYSVIKGLEYKLESFLKTEDRVKYTIDFTLTKSDNKWLIDNLTEDELSKIHGTYAH